MSKPILWMHTRTQVIDGVTYPRDVPVLEGMPSGWKGVEQAYGQSSRSAGKTYIRYHSLDGRHRQMMTPKQVIEKHCDDNGLVFSVEYAKYEDVVKAKKDAAERDDRIALSKAVLGHLTGPLCLGLPGWKCRWEFLPESKETQTFLDDVGREWKLLKDVECWFGTALHGGGEEAFKVIAMVEAAKLNTYAHDLFHVGATWCRETEGVCTTDPAGSRGSKRALI